MALAEALKSNSTLQTLKLSGNRVGVKGTMALAEALKSNSTLQTLELHYNNIGDNGAKALAEALKSNSTLQVLWKLISNPNTRDNIGIDHVWCIADGWKQAKKIGTKSLRRLRLGSNKIGDKGATAILEGLKTNSTLEHLYMYGNNISKSLNERIEREMSAESRENRRRQLEPYNG